MVCTLWTMLTTVNKTHTATVRNANPNSTFNF